MRKLNARAGCWYAPFGGFMPLPQPYSHGSRRGLGLGGSLREPDAGVAPATDDTSLPVPVRSGHSTTMRGGAMPNSREFVRSATATKPGVRYGPMPTELSALPQ